MRSIATCYSEHAVKVSDSYCSGPPTRPTIIARNLMKRPVPSSITSTYKLAAGIFAAVNWSGGQGFSFSITDKIPPLKPNPLDCPSPSSSSFRQFRKLKGSKEFQACGSKIELFWNLSLASYYDSGPEPGSGFYIVVLVDSKPALFLGDIDDIEEEEEELLEFKSEIKRADFSPISRIEKFSCTQSGSGSGYTTRAQFSKVGEVHDVAIRFGSGEDGPAMSVWIDGRKAFEVERLKWNFRGNQTVFLDGISVDVMWDLHAWLDKGDDRDRERGGVFMFRTRTGFDSRLWLDEKILRPHKDPDRDEFSLVICLCKDQRR